MGISNLPGRTPMGAFYRSPLGAVQRESRGEAVFFAGILNSCFYFNENGSIKIYTLLHDLEYILQYKINANVDNITFLRKTDVSEITIYTYDITFKPDGTSMYILMYESMPQNRTRTMEFSLSVPWNANTATYIQTFDNPGYGEIAFTFKPDGTKMYLMGGDEEGINNKIYQLALSPSWDISSMTVESTLTFAVDTMFGFVFSPDGTKLYIANSGDLCIYQYNLTSPWNVSTGVYVGKADAITDSQPRSVGVSPDGTKLYMVCRHDPLSNIDVFTMSTPWDISTASYDRKSFNLCYYE